MQCGFLYYIQREVDTKSCGPGTNPFVRLLALSAFSVSILGEFFETLTMFYWVWNVKTEESHCEVRIANIDGQDEWASGMTKVQKIYFAIFSLIPKACIGVVLLYLGGHYVALSPTNNDLILNCVAIVFIIDFDDILYRTFTPIFIKKVMAELPPIRFRSVMSGLFDVLVVPYIKALFFAVIVIGLELSSHC